MAMLTDDMVNEILTRLRETEAQTREQQVKIESLTSLVKANNDNTCLFIKHLDEREARSEKREKNLMTLIYTLIGTLVFMALGPRIAKDVISTVGKVPLACVETVPIAPMPDHALYVLEKNKAAA